MEKRSDGSFIYLGWITIAVVTFQLISDATAGKIIDLFGYTVSVTVLYFPITYVFSDILTEVYGYARARSVLWKSMFASIVAGIIYQLAVYWPPAPSFPLNDSYRDVFGIVPRILVGGWVAVFLGEITNNFVMAKLKVVTAGKALWLRAMSSTLCGQLVNTAAFYLISLSGILPSNILVQAILAGWLIKTAMEAVCLPLTYAACRFLKQAENIDHLDRNTDFNPFIIFDDKK